MNTACTHNQLEDCLTRIVRYGQEMQHLDLSAAVGRERALEKAQRLLGLITLYRRMLDCVEQREPVQRRLAA